jgi:hypothetical protein
MVRKDLEQLLVIADVVFVLEDAPSIHMVWRLDLVLVRFLALSRGTLQRIVLIQERDEPALNTLHARLVSAWHGVQRELSIHADLAFSKNLTGCYIFTEASE